MPGGVSGTGRAQSKYLFVYIGLIPLTLAIFVAIGVAIYLACKEEPVTGPKGEGVEGRFGRWQRQPRHQCEGAFWQTFLMELNFVFLLYHYPLRELCCWTIAQGSILTDLVSLLSLQFEHHENGLDIRGA